jgi:hypothetical protein
MGKRRARKRSDDGWKLPLLLALLLVPVVLFPWVALAILSFVMLLVVPTLGLLGFVLATRHVLNRIAKSIEENSTTFPLLPAHAGGSKYSERAVIEDTKIVIRKVDRARGVKKEAYMRKRRIEITREVDYAPAGPETGSVDFLRPLLEEGGEGEEGEENW